MDPLRNPKDPLHHATHPGARELFRQVSSLCDGFSGEQALDAGINLVINSLRQMYPTWDKVEVAFDEKFGQAKTILRGHYDTVSGRKKGIFPYDQVLEPAHITFAKRK